jgi:hypothetical protein
MERVQLGFAVRSLTTLTRSARASVVRRTPSNPVFKVILSSRSIYARQQSQWVPKLCNWRPNKKNLNLKTFSFV